MHCAVMHNIYVHIPLFPYFCFPLPALHSLDFFEFFLLLVTQKLVLDIQDQIRFPQAIKQPGPFSLVDLCHTPRHHLPDSVQRMVSKKYIIYFWWTLFEFPLHALSVIHTDLHGGCSASGLEESGHVIDMWPGLKASCLSGGHQTVSYQTTLNSQPRQPCILWQVYNARQCYSIICSVQDFGWESFHTIKL